MKLIPISFLSLLVSLALNGQTMDTVVNVNEEPVKKVLANFIDAWNRHDAKAFSMVFTENAEFTNVGGNSKIGRKEIEKHHEPGFQTKWKESHQQITKTKIRFIRQDVAAVDAWWDLTGIKGPEGQEMPPRKGILSFIMTKDNGIWLIDVMHNMEFRDSK